ncbi:MAG: EAL domain-containing protein [Marinomonas sp.]
MPQKQFSAWALSLVAALLMAIFGVGTQLEDQLQNWRDSVNQKPATGDLVLVEIDAQSLHEMDSWPWPRKHYGDAVKKLNAAGVTQIAFDIDFSAHSDPAQDKAFADAIAASDATVILPTLKQSGSEGSEDELESFPIPILAENAFLASVNVKADYNGQLNHYSYGTKTGGIPRPTLASMLSGSAGKVEESFAINQAIDPKSIPRISFVDLVNGEPMIEELRGKKVVIGATAIELGDRYPIRRFSVIPGVLIQALATESLLQDAVAVDLGTLFSLIITAGLLLFCFRVLKMRRVFLASAAIAIGFTGLQLALEAAHIATFSNVPMLVFLAIFLTLQKFFVTSTALHRSQMRNAQSGLPNEAAMRAFISDKTDLPVIVAKIDNFRDVAALTNGASREELFTSLSQRLSFLAMREKVFHLDADSFAWVLEDGTVSSVAAHCETAAALFQSPFMAGDKKLSLKAVFGASIGKIEQSKMAADQASGKNERWAWHDDTAQEAVDFQQRLLVDLESALKGGDVTTVFQPKWDIAMDRIQGAEALVRWEHQELGFVSPEIFIPLLERENRIDELTLHVLRSAVANLSHWNTILPDLNCSVNISAALLGDAKFVEAAIEEVLCSNLDAKQLVFEVTETATLANQDATVAALERIREAGMKVSIDDYGTGQSTLSYLQRLPIDEIKIDQSFVKTMVSNKGNKVLVQSTIQMAHALELTVVAEGIEDAECLALLSELGCDTGQGWHIAKPLSSDDFVTKMLRNDAGQNKLSAAAS